MINAFYYINKHLCLLLSLYEPFRFLGAFHCSPFTPTRSALRHLLCTPPIHPSIPFGRTLSGTLELFIKASKPTASNTQPLERKKGEKEHSGEFGARGMWKEETGELWRTWRRKTQEKKHKRQGWCKAWKKQNDKRG